jgi:hypothetical protein
MSRVIAGGGASSPYDPTVTKLLPVRDRLATLIGEDAPDIPTGGLA